MGDQANDILYSTKLSAAQLKQYHTVKTKFDEHFVICRNVIFKQAKFNWHQQEEGETVNSLVAPLHALTVTLTVLLGLFRMDWSETGSLLACWTPNSWKNINLTLSLLSQKRCIRHNKAKPCWDSKRWWKTTLRNPRDQGRSGCRKLLGSCQNPRIRLKSTQQ